MLKIKLKRIGKKGEPTYRFIVTESYRPRSSESIVELGSYNPMTDPATVIINKEETEKWLKNGAQPTDTVAQLFVKQGILKSLKKGSKLSKGKAKKKAQAAE
jgi:small subunit ribosomal protein S16